MSRRSKKRNILIGMSVAIAAIAIYFGIAYGPKIVHHCKSYLISKDIEKKKINLSETVYIYITPQDNTNTVIKKIKAVIPNAPTDGFKKLAEHNNFDSHKRSGKYAIKNGDTMKDIYKRIVSRQQTPVRVTIPSTRDVQMAIGAISRQLMVDSTELAAYTNPTVISCFGHNKETTPAFFIPDTYEVYWDVSAEDFFKKLASWERQFWNEERKSKAKTAGMTPVEVATLASIVDEETSNVQEMPIVAGLYINRLKKGIPLQADPTVKFALGDPTRKRILKKDLEVNSPYNTYKITGLPPGPIRIPTKQAMESVLNYKKHDYLYMCAKEDFSGTHNFAKTLTEHNANAQKYQKALNKLNIKK